MTVQAHIIGVYEKVNEWNATHPHGPVKYVQRIHDEYTIMEHSCTELEQDVQDTLDEIGRNVAECRQIVADIGTPTTNEAEK